MQIVKIDPSAGKLFLASLYSLHSVEFDDVAIGKVKGTLVKNIIVLLL
jgi:hypothetical protein